MFQIESESPADQIHTIFHFARKNMLITGKLFWTNWPERSQTFGKIFRQCSRADVKLIPCGKDESKALGIEMIKCIMCTLIKACVVIWSSQQDNDTSEVWKYHAGLV